MGVGWVSLLVLACRQPEIPVGATLQDGQVLVGAISTPTLRLDGALGAVDVPLDAVGLLVPVEGTTLGQSHGNVDVWLRNGSELKGRWADPALAMDLEVGRTSVGVEVPTDDLQALQLRGSEAWPDRPVYRVVTTHGDDFLVDPESTQVHLENALGSFAPYLAECRSIGPVGATSGDWRVELQTGTVLVGKVTEKALTFALPMGPAQVEVPLDALVSMSQGGWVEDQTMAPPLAAATPADALESARGLYRTAEEPQAAKPALSSSDGWFDNRRMYDAKH
jgi:hypothetical protein